MNAAAGSAVNRPRKSIWKRLGENIRNHPLLYLLALPVVAYYIIFCYWPMYGVVIAFQNFKPALGIAGSKWVGLKHFEKFVKGMYFGRLVRNTLSINLGMLLVGFPLPIVFALLLNELPSRGFQRVTQTVTYMPHFISTVVVCGLMLQFSGSAGILTRLLSYFGLKETNLFTVPSYFQPLYIGMNVWQNMGWDSIIFFAALTAIDPEQHEAALIDGAGRWRRMIHVTIPGIMPTVVILLIMRIGNLMSLGWDQIVLLYNERVYETADVISTYVYRTGLTKYEYSFGSAVGLFNSLINILLLDGANDIQILAHIVLPLSVPVLAVIGMYYAVGLWNSWYPSLIFHRERKFYPLQMILREMLILNELNTSDSAADMVEEAFNRDLIKYCTIMVATVPILVFYPFLQRYFVKGVMISAIKG